MAITVDDGGHIKYIPPVPGTQNFGFVVGGGPGIPGFEIPVAPGQAPGGNGTNGSGSSGGGGGGSGGGGGGGGSGGAPGLDPNIRAYMDAAAVYGYDFSMSQYQHLLQLRVSPTEFAQRLADIKRTQDQSALLDAFGQVLYARGIVKDPNLTLAERLAYVAGAAPASWYNVNREFQVWVDAIHGGFSVGKSGTYDLSRGQILGIMNRFPNTSEGDLLQGFQQLAQDFKYAIPRGRWTGFNVSENDLIALEFGSNTPGLQVEVADKVQRALGTYQAAQQPRANPLTAVTAGGPAQYGFGGAGGGKSL